MKTILIVEIDHADGYSSDMAAATRTLLDSFLYRHCVDKVTVKDASKWLTPAVQLQILNEKYTAKAPT